MRLEAQQPHAGDREQPRCEDAFAAALLALARRYAAARSDHELASAFFELAAPFAPEAVITVHVRSPNDHVVRGFSSAAAHEALAPAVVSRAAVPEEITDREGWSVVDTAPGGHAEIVGTLDASLIVVATTVGVLEGVDRRRLARFCEQLATAAVDIAERSETARLRLYAGSIVDRTNVPIAIVDSRGALRLSNGALRTEIGDASILELVDVADRHRAISAHTRALRGRASSGIEISLHVAPDVEKRMLVDFEPIPLPSGEIESVLVVGRDVTRVRQLEDQVTHADRLATLGQLAAGVVHELNNPLTTILVYTEYLLRKANDEAEDVGDREKLRRILGAAERIQEFAKNLVTYSRAERGERESLDVSTVIDESVAFCEPLIDRRRVVVVRSYEDIPLLPAVRVQLQQVFINLLTNGIQAVPEPGGRILISLASHTPGWVHVRFEDNGPGVPPERRDEIFRPFITTKPTGQGTGLGLSIVRNLVERHGGTIEVTEAAGGGARFVVALPVKAPSEPPPKLALE